MKLSEVVNFAGQADLIRSTQKDDYYVSHLRQCAWAAIDALPSFGNLQTICYKWRNEINIFLEGMYFCLTNGRGSRTLGEEYCDLIEVTGKDFKNPSILRRFLWIVIHILPYYFFRKFMGEFSAPLRIMNRRDYPFLAKFMIVINDEIIPDLKRFHLAIFFLFGRFLHISKRLANISSLFISSAKRPLTTNFALSILLLAQVALNLHKYCTLLLWRRLFKWKTILDSEKNVTENLNNFSSSPDKLESVDLENGGDYDSPGMSGKIELPKCSFCLTVCTNPTSTSCGHIFCWNCISQWCLTNKSCPLCRAFCLPQHLIRIRHYASSYYIKQGHH